MKLKKTTLPAFLFISFLFCDIASAQTDPDSLTHYLLSGSTVQAIIALEQRLSRDTANPEVMFMLSGLLMDEDRYHEARKWLEKAYSLEPANAGLVARLGNCYAYLGQYSEGISLLERAQKDLSADPGISRILVKLYMSEERFIPALQRIDSALATGDASHWFIRQKATCLARLGRLSEALGQVDKALLLNPYDVILIGQAVNLCIRTREFGRGLAYCSAGLNIDPSGRTLRRQAGYLHLLLGHADTAIILLKGLYDEGDTGKFTSKYLGLAYVKADQTHESVPFLETAYRTDSSDAETAFYLGMSYGRTTHKDKAIPVLKHAMELMLPDSSTLAKLYSELAYNYYFLNEHRKVLECYLQARKLDPANSLVLFEIGNLYQYGLNDLVLALEYYERYLEAIGYEHRDEPDESNPMIISVPRTVYRRIQNIREELHFRGIRLKRMP